ncbi:hypothetical protein Pmani_036607 [Petrolisthes manimaculis]|uniref:Uncharacterized protein n=1 Tax=Petrolisthes manimaculis TaxID=1843537 RepID=A0AAE1TP89_9EUCA|nr:hypothetical protein Pmani_036607 [Petrolisthes manimaculis]
MLLQCKIGDHSSKSLQEPPGPPLLGGPTGFLQVTAECNTSLLGPQHQEGRGSHLPNQLSRVEPRASTRVRTLLDHQANKTGSVYWRIGPLAASWLTTTPTGYLMQHHMEEMVILNLHCFANDSSPRTHKTVKDNNW